MRSGADDATVVVRCLGERWIFCDLQQRVDCRNCNEFMPADRFWAKFTLALDLLSDRVAACCRRRESESWKS